MLICISFAGLRQLSEDGATMGTKVRSDFSATRFHLDMACQHLNGDDDVSPRLSEALDLLIEAVAMAEHRPARGQVVPFRSGH